MTEPHVITTEPEEITLTEGVEIVQLVRPGARTALVHPAPGPHPRVQAAPPAKGKGSRARR